MQPLTKWRRTSEHLRGWLSFKVYNSIATETDAINRASKRRQAQQSDGAEQHLPLEILTESDKDAIHPQPEGGDRQEPFQKTDQVLALANRGEARRDVNRARGSSVRLPGRRSDSRKGRSPVMWVMAVVSFTSVMGNRF